MKQFIFRKTDGWDVVYLASGQDENQNIQIDEIRSIKNGKTTVGLIDEAKTLGLPDSFTSTTIAELENKAIDLDLELIVFSPGAQVVDSKITNTGKIRKLSEEGFVISANDQFMGAGTPKISPVNFIEFENMAPPQGFVGDIEVSGDVDVVVDGIIQPPGKINVWQGSMTDRIEIVKNGKVLRKYSISTIPPGGSGGLPGDGTGGGSGVVLE